MKSSDFSLIHKEISLWYEGYGRKDLPWRNLEHEIPYGVYVSEMMLQQTQVKTVLPYFERFMQRFPSLQSLSQSEEDEVLLYWQGLGYYSRAKNMLKSAKICAEKSSGLPESFKELLELPGIGEYSAGAILCFGFKKAWSFWDGNIKRVLSRFFSLKDGSKKILDEKAREFLNLQDPYNHNQALLDIGALICMPKFTLCHQCPLEISCQGKKNPLSYDVRKKIIYENRTLHLGVYYHQGSVAMIRDPEWNLLFSFPKIDPKGQKPFAEVTHTRTKYKIKAYLYHLFLQPDSTQMIAKTKKGFYPMSSLSLKALKKVWGE